ncbi:MAG: hypothetical protein M3162_02235, partial [Thermoproteota archaeon]|nr:hypothetical protein [Thermoproteota archaeon]
FYMSEQEADDTPQRVSSISYNTRLNPQYFTKRTKERRGKASAQRSKPRFFLMCRSCLWIASSYYAESFDPFNNNFTTCPSCHDNDLIAFPFIQQM